MPRRMNYVHGGLGGIILILFCGMIAGAVSIVNDTTYVLTWTAPGDDGQSGRAHMYDLRYFSTPPVDDTLQWWQNASRVPGEPRPSAAGISESMTLQGFSIYEVYYFALETVDEAGNRSGVSNIVTFPNLTCADINGDGEFNLADPTYLLAYIYNQGPAPVGGDGDIDNSGIVNLIDATLLLKYLNMEGPPPPCPGNR